MVQPGGYSLTDSTYASLLHKIVQQPTQPIPPGIKEDIQKYYSNLDLPITTKKDPDRWKQVLADLNTLAGMPTSNAPEPFPTYVDDQDEDEYTLPAPLISLGCHPEQAEASRRICGLVPSRLWHAPGTIC